jgi:hypothetical protein
MRCDFSATMDEQGDVRLDGHMVCYEPWIDGMNLRGAASPMATAANDGLTSSYIEVRNP